MRLGPEGITRQRGGLPILNMQAYWNETMPGKPQKKFDKVFQLHGSLGGILRPDLVKPYGQIYDLRALCYRTPIEYPLNK